MTNRRLCRSSALPLLLLSACITREAPGGAPTADSAVDAAEVPSIAATVPDEPAGVDGAVDVGDDRDVASNLPPPLSKELGATCATAVDCASGFCVDGVCCDGACDQECLACAVPGALGQCTALDGVEDLSAMITCAGFRICATDPSGSTACRLKDGESCTQSADCASGYCRRYFRDQDGDGYGVDSPTTISRCDVTAQPPQGFTTIPGDCCDTDSRAHPGVTAYFTTRDACGSFDWNCSGADEKQAGRMCPSASGAALSCGQACTFVFKGTGTVLFVQACH
jgi:hypothetical protein